MQQKIRLIIMILLVAISVASIFMGLQAVGSKKAMESEAKSLKDENAALAAKIDELSKEKTRLQEKITALDVDLEKVSREKEEAQKQYEALAKEKDDSAARIKTLQRNNEQLRTDLSNLSREKAKLGQDLQENLSPLKNENAQLKEQLDNLKAAKGKLEAELAQIKGEKSGIEQKLNQIDSILEQKLTRYRYLTIKEELDAIGIGGAGQAQAEPAALQQGKESVELPPIVVRPQSQPQSEVPFKGKISPALKKTGAVLDVNKENGFVIIDLGQDAGTKVGDTFRVYRQGRPIAAIEAIQVRQSISACDIKEEITPIQPGDIVR